MDHRSLSNLLLRLAGLIIVISSAVEVPWTAVRLIVAGGTYGTVTSALVLSCIAALLPILVGLLLVWFPGTVTNRIVGAASNDEATNSGNQVRLEQMAVATLGLYFALSALFDAVYWFAKLRLYYIVIAAEPYYVKPPPVPPDDFGGIVSTGVELIVGICLLLGSKGFMVLIAKVRGHQG